MNAIFFGLKRAFHGTLRITRASLARLGLTAARFDLLYALPHGFQLTRRGCTLIRKAKRMFIDSGWAQLALDTAFDVGQPGGRWCDDFHCFAEMDTLEGLLRRVRDAFGDFARLHYPWHPDD